jgi:CheY-like chemotaxis protein
MGILSQEVIPLDSILIVDDEREVRESLSRIFSKEGYNVLLAENGAKALELLAETPVNIVVADVRMEGMDGLSLLREAKKVRPSIDRRILPSSPGLPERTPSYRSHSSE